MAERVLLLATTTGYQTRAFGEAADALGAELVFATDRCEQIDDPWRDGAIAIRFHDEDGAVDSILASAAHRPIDGILAVGDRPTVIAARAAAALGIPWHPPEAAAIARHKLLTRERLSAAGLLVPWFMPVPATNNPGDVQPRAFPCIVKPMSLSGSRGVMRADNRASFVSAFERLRTLLRSPDVQAERNAAHETILVEGFIPGREFAIEGLLHHGALHVLAVFDKPDPLDGPFFEETIYVTPSAATAADREVMVAAVGRAAQAIGLRHGPIHAECRVNEQGVFVLEVAARPIGGICARALTFAGHGSAISLEELLLRHALGGGPPWRMDGAASGVMMIPIPRRGVYRGVDGVEDARKIAQVTDVRITAKPDQRLIPLPEGASYLGFIFARAGTSAAVVDALRAAHARLAFRVDAELPVIGPREIRYNRSHG